MIDEERAARIRALKAELAALEDEPAHHDQVIPDEPVRGLPEWVMWIWVVGGILLVIFAIAGWSMTRDPKRVVASTGSGESGPVAVPALQAPKTWQYVESQDEMRGGAIRQACVISENEVRLSPPYSNQLGRLCVRQHPAYGLDVIVGLSEEGQLRCDLPGCTIAVRFDEGPVQTFSVATPADYSSETVFVRNASGFLAALRKAETTRVEMSFYEAGTQLMAFPTKGLVWE